MCFLSDQRNLKKILSISAVTHFGVSSIDVTYKTCGKATDQKTVIFPLSDSNRCRQMLRIFCNLSVFSV